ncbi:MAG: hypothetical protein AB7V27_17155 [Candidatus Binatia bacterium]
MVNTSTTSPTGCTRDQISRSSKQPLFTGWARELAQAAQRAFTYAPRRGGPKQNVLKLSIDLSRPLVTSMGQHDPLDGLVTYAQLEATAAGTRPSLVGASADFAAMIDPRGLATPTRSESVACWWTRIASHSSSGRAPGALA